MKEVTFLSLLQFTLKECDILRVFGAFLRSDRAALSLFRSDSLAAAVRDSHQFTSTGINFRVSVDFHSIAVSNEEDLPTVFAQVHIEGAGHFVLFVISSILAECLNIVEAFARLLQVIHQRGHHSQHTIFHGGIGRVRGLANRGLGLGLIGLTLKLLSELAVLCKLKLCIAVLLLLLCHIQARLDQVWVVFQPGDRARSVKESLRCFHLRRETEEQIVHRHKGLNAPEVIDTFCRRKRVVIPHPGSGGDGELLDKGIGCVGPHEKKVPLRPIQTIEPH